MTNEPKDDLFDPNPNRPIPDILATIARGAKRGATEGTVTTVFTVVPLAALNVRLATDADRTAKKVLRLTWALIALTGALLIFTVILATRG